MATTHTSLDAAAIERKARLAKLASLKRKQPSGDEGDNEERGATTKDTSTSSEIDPSLKHLSFRNYDSETRGPKLGFEESPIGPDQETLEKRAAQLAAETKAQEEKEQKEKDEGKGIDLFDLQPRKPNWDLKRDLSRKMETLQQRTDNAIARLVRERLEGQKKLEQTKAMGPNGNSKRGADADADEGGGEGVGIRGVDLVEGIHVREREEAEQERRERDQEDDLG